MIDVCLVDRVMGGVGIHEILMGGVIKGEGCTGLSVIQIIFYRGIWRGCITYWSVSGWMPGVRVCVLGIDSPFGWRCGSSSGIVLLELLDSHITQKFDNVSRKVDGARKPSGVGCPTKSTFMRMTILLKILLLKILLKTQCMSA